MKLDKKLYDAEASGVLESTEFGIDKKATSMLMQGFSDSLYSDKIGSLVREIVSNCYDANVEAGKINDPVIIQWKEDYILFKDVGIGMSPERVKNTYSKYFASSKRKSNEEIGGFGIGAKSPFAYTDMFFIDTVHNGIEYKYCLYKSNPFFKIDLLSKRAVGIPSGTTVKVPTKKNPDSYYSSEFSKFFYAVEKQLEFFPNLVFKGFRSNDDKLNDYSILQGKNFIARKNSSNHIGICLGYVRYPLNIDLLFKEVPDLIESFHPGSLRDLRLALRFEIGELTPTFNRESIEYNEENIKKIAKKLKDVRLELLDKLKKEIDKVKNLEELKQAYIKFTNNYSQLIFEEEGIRLELSCLKTHNFIKENLPKELEFTKEYYSSLSLQSFSNTLEITKDGSTAYKSRKNQSSISWKIFLNISSAKDSESRYIIQTNKDFLSKRKLLYLFHKFNAKRFFIIKKLSHDDSPSAKYDKENYLKYCKEEIKIIEKYAIKYSEHTICEKWLKEYKKSLKEKRKEVSENDTIIVTRYRGTRGRHTIKALKGLTKTKLIIFYTEKEAKSVINDTVMSIAHYQRNPVTLFYKVSEPNKEKLEALDHDRILTIEQFKKTYEKILIRILAFSRINYILDYSRISIIYDPKIKKIYGELKRFLSDSKVLPKWGNRAYNIKSIENLEDPYFKQLRDKVKEYVYYDKKKNKYVQISTLIKEYEKRLKIVSKYEKYANHFSWYHSNDPEFIFFVKFSVNNYIKFKKDGNKK